MDRRRTDGNRVGYAATACRVCGARVFFVRPQGGGCIWVDELGAPWPLHRCMHDDDAVAPGDVIGTVNFVQASLPRQRSPQPDPFTSGACVHYDNFPGIDLRGRDLRGIALLHLDLTDALLDDADLSRATILGCDLTAASMRRVLLVNADVRRNHMIGVDLSGAVLRSADLRGSDLRHACLPGAVFGREASGGRRRAGTTPGHSHRGDGRRRAGQGGHPTRLGG